MPLIRDLLLDDLDEAGLADARLARQDDDLPLAFGRLPPAVEQERHLFVPPN